LFENDVASSQKELNDVVVHTFGAFAPGWIVHVELHWKFLKHVKSA